MSLPLLSNVSLEAPRSAPSAALPLRLKSDGICKAVGVANCGAGSKACWLSLRSSILSQLSRDLWSEQNLAALLREELEYG